MTKSSHSDKLGYAGVRLRALWAMEKLSVWFCGLYTTPCLTGLLYGYDTVSISGAIDFLSDKYGRRRSTGRRAKSSTRPRLLRLLAN
ncbi:sugar porter family MFS transporter [Bifidobacterium longum]|nr:sugar porter family MFS transporter [Bifidobacterium longum]